MRLLGILAGAVMAAVLPPSLPSALCFLGAGLCFNANSWRV